MISTFSIFCELLGSLNKLFEYPGINFWSVAIIDGFKLTFPQSKYSSPNDKVTSPVFASTEPDKPAFLVFTSNNPQQDLTVRCEIFCGLQIFFATLAPRPSPDLFRPPLLGLYLLALKADYSMPAHVLLPLFQTRLNVSPLRLPKASLFPERFRNFPVFVSPSLGKLPLHLFLSICD